MSIEVSCQLTYTCVLMIDTAVLVYADLLSTTVY